MHRSYVWWVTNKPLDRIIGYDNRGKSIKQMVQFLRMGLKEKTLWQIFFVYNPSRLVFFSSTDWICTYYNNHIDKQMNDTSIIYEKLLDRDGLLIRKLRSTRGMSSQALLYHPFFSGYDTQIGRQASSIAAR